jgi:hypothetical protein
VFTDVCNYAQLSIVQKSTLSFLCFNITCNHPELTQESTPLSLDMVCPSTPASLGPVCYVTNASVPRTLLKLFSGTTGHDVTIFEETKNLCAYTKGGHASKDLVTSCE